MKQVDQPTLSDFCHLVVQRRISSQENYLAQEKFSNKTQNISFASQCTVTQQIFLQRRNSLHLCSYIMHKNTSTELHTHLTKFRAKQNYLMHKPTNATNISTELHTHARKFRARQKQLILKQTNEASCSTNINGYVSLRTAKQNQFTRKLSNAKKC